MTNLAFCRPCSVLCTSIFVTLAGLTSIVFAQGVSNTAVNIAVILPLSSNQSDIGLAYFKGAQACLKEVNARKIFGRTINLVPNDDLHVPSMAVEILKETLAAKKESEQAFALMGVVGDSIADALLPVAVAAKMPVIGPLVGSEKNMAYAGQNGVFTLRRSDKEMLSAMLHQLTAMRFRSVSVVFVNDTSGLARLAMLEQLIKDKGLVLVSKQGVAANVNVFEQDASVLLSKPADAILSMAGALSSAALLKTIKQKGFPGLFMAPSTVGVRSLSTHASKEVVRGAIMGFPITSVADGRMSVVREFRKRMGGDSAEFADDDAAFEGCTAALVLAEGLRRAGQNLTRDGFIKGLNSRPVQVDDISFTFGSKPAQPSAAASLAIFGSNGKLVQ